MGKVSFLRGRKGMEEEGRGTFGSERRERIILEERRGCERSFLCAKRRERVILEGKEGEKRERRGREFLHGEGKGSFLWGTKGRWGERSFFCGEGRGKVILERMR